MRGPRQAHQLVTAGENDIDTTWKARVIGGPLLGKIRQQALDRNAAMAGNARPTQYHRPLLSETRDLDDEGGRPIRKIFAALIEGRERKMLLFASQQRELCLTWIGHDRRASMEAKIGREGYLIRTKEQRRIAIGQGEQERDCRRPGAQTRHRRKIDSLDETRFRQSRQHIAEDHL